MTRALLAGILILLVAAPAQAKQWTVDYAHSKIGFTAMQGTDVIEGGFKKFKVNIDMDLNKPETGKIDAVVDIASVYAGTAERDSTLPQPDFFDTARFPHAEFVSTLIQKTGDNRYETAGNLTIKGAAKLITIPFTLEPEGDHYRAKAKVLLIRSDFGIGLGQWASDSAIKREVDVTLDIVAR